MFSKVSVRSLIIFWAPLVMFSCDLPIYEKPPAKPNLQFSAGATGCLSESLDVIKNYFQGAGAPAKVAASWDCSVGALDTFMKSARGQEAESYTPQELANFIETYFLKETPISSELLHEAMLIKQLFVGGSTISVTREELRKTQDLLLFFKEESLKLLPHMKIFSFNWADREGDLSTDSASFEQAKHALRAFAQVLGHRVSENSQQYSIAEFVSFLEEVESLYQGNWAFASAARKYLPLVGKIKGALVGGDHLQVAPGEWQNFLILGSRSYAQYLRYYYFIETGSYGQSGDLTVFLRGLDDVSSILHDLVALKPSQEISKAELLDILVSLHSFWPRIKISEKLLDEIMRLKQLFFAGDQESVRLEDFKNVRAKLSTLGAIAELNVPLLSYFTLQNRDELFGSTAAQKLQAKSRVALHKSAKQLTEIMEGSYRFEDFVSFLKELRSVYHNQARWAALDDLDAVLPMVKKLKTAFVGGPADRVLTGEWSRVLNSLAVASTEFLEYSYFVGENADAEVKDLYSAELTDRLIQHLGMVLKQKEPSTISGDQLQELLHEGEALISGSQYPAGFSDQILRLKKLVLGGSAQMVSADELLALGGLLQRYRNLWSLAQPHLNYLTGNWSPEDSQDPEGTRRGAEDLLGRAVDQLLKDLKGDYSPSEFISFLDQLNAFTGGALAVDTRAMKTHLQLFGVVKAEIVGGPGDLILANEWSKLLSWGAEAYASFLQYKYFVADSQWTMFQGAPLAQLQSVADRGFALLSQMLERQAHQGLSQEQIRRIFRELESELYFGSAWDSDFTLRVVSYISRRLFPDFSAPDSEALLLTPGQLFQIKQEFQAWASVQEGLDSVFTEPRMGRKEVFSKWRRFTEETAYDAEPLRKQAYQELLRTLSGPYPMVHNSAEEIWLLNEELQPLYQLSDLTALNWKRAAVRILIRAYAQDEVRRDELIGVTNAEAEKFFREVRGFAIELGLLDPKNFHFMQSRFMEANIFTQRANGDKLYDFEEGVEQLSLLASGVRLNGKQTPALLRECMMDSDNSLPKHEMIVSLACMRRVYLSDLPALGSNMPGMVEHFAQLSDEEQYETFLDVEVAANLQVLPGGQARVSDVELLPYTLQYIENVFVRFDTDHNGFFDLSEALSAFPVYKTLLKEFVPLDMLKDDSSLEAIFTYLLKYGEVPSLKNSPWFLWWKLRPSSWELEADRSRLARVMAEIRRVINASKVDLQSAQTIDADEMRGE